MKESTKQILKVSICILMALVLFAGVILMCIYFAFDNSNDGVANAYSEEEVGVDNLFVSTNEGFYLKNFIDTNRYEVDKFVNYLCYFIPGLGDSSEYIEYVYNDVGTFRVRYINSSNVYRTITTPIHLCIYKESDDNILNIYSYIEDVDYLNIFDLYYNVSTKVLQGYTTDFYIKFDLSTDYYSYISITDSPQTDSTFANQIATVFGVSDDISSIHLVGFEFNNFVNLGTIISTSTTFANLPIVMPQGVYDGILHDNYVEGYDEGHYAGYAEGHTLGYETGYQSGKTDGYNQGYNAGVSSQQSTILDLQQQITELQSQVSQRDSLIEELRDEIRYYESLDLNMSLIDVFNPALMKSSTFVYDGVTYTSNSIVSTDDGWRVYSSTYVNQELPPNYGVGFSLFLPESITNTKFYVYGDITGWYNYTYCSEPDEQGNQQCYQVTDMIPDISVGYRNQNGNIVKVGTFTSNLPGAGGVDFFIDSPTNEIVFFVENCNLMEVGRSVQVAYYQYDTQSIYNEGFENGKSQGLKVGREEGYYQGVADANDYSFFSLFTSVFDAPITAIVGKWGDSDGDGVYQREGGMLNFYIPGLDINFAPFLLSLFTIAIIILVIRFVMARKS